MVIFKKKTIDENGNDKVKIIFYKEPEMKPMRKIAQTFKSQQTLEGAGVKLSRAFGNSQAALFDPFLLLDDFRSARSQDYIKGFPWHPHRGIETITYVLNGSVEHGDSLGNKGIIGPGDLQWMSAGSGIIHQEMPKPDLSDAMGGFQLWANLPAAHKMGTPRYQEIKADQIPLVYPIEGVSIKVICGKVHGQRGPVTDVMIDPSYLDISLTAGVSYLHPILFGHTAFAYVIGGKVLFDGATEPREFENGSLILFTDGDLVKIWTDKSEARLLLISGKPLREPIAWWGPIVMNTSEELEIAFKELEDGTFIKQRS